MTTTIQTLDAEFDNRDLLIALDEIEGDVQAAVDWVDDAFGEIEAELGQLAPVRAMKRVFALLLRL